ncbi:enoyl-CoA hydratase/isomerase family protein [soil metagenome]
MNDVLVSRRGGLGLITLNRPKAINALTHGMVTAITEQLRLWAEDDTVRTVAIGGAGPRGLCAGGDIVSLYRDATDGDGSSSAAFWADEYRLNSMIANYPKPYVALMDGIVLGGGIGISAHGSHRIVTERSSLGMPETGIGFVPDVGGTWLLAHAPGELGTHLALTAGSVQAGDAIALGLADHYLRAARIPQLIVALETQQADVAVASVVEEPPASALLHQREWIDAAYAGDDLAEIVARLAGSAIDDARTAAATIGAKSPTALAVTLAAVRRAAELDSLEAALEQEFRVSIRALTAHDFAEGVRAQVIDRDRDPHWSPATIAGVSAEEVASYFEPLRADEPQFSIAVARH